MSAIIWSKYHCPYCDQAKALLTQRNIVYEERKIGDGYTREELLEAVPNARTVPQIFINNQLIGGFTELRTYLEQTAGGFGEGKI
jgi:glutaredoxin 3